MKALNLYGKQDVRYEDAPELQYESKDDVIIRVKVAGICSCLLSG